MVRCDVLLEAVALTLEVRTLDAADETAVLAVLAPQLVLGAELAERVDNDSKDNVQEDDVHKHEEGETQPVKHGETPSLATFNHDVANAAAVAHPLADDEQDARVEPIALVIVPRFPP